MATKVNPRSIGVEGPFIPSDPVAARRMGRLLEALETEGYAWRQIAGIRAWLEAKAVGRPDPTSVPTWSRYRKIIGELKLDPGPKRRQSTNVDREAVELALVRNGHPRSRARAAAKEAIRALAPIMYLPSSSPVAASTDPLAAVA